MLCLANSLFIDILAFAFCPVVIIAPLSALVVLCGSAFAAKGWFTEREVMTQNALLSNIMIAFGIALGSGFGPHRQDNLSIQDMMDNALSIRFAIYAIPALLITVAAMGLTSMRAEMNPMWRCVIFSVSSSCCGTLSVVSWKAFALLLRGEIENQTGDLFGRGGFVFFLAATLLGPLNVFLASCALEGDRALTSVPIYTGLMALNTVIGGGQFYNEFQAMTHTEFRATFGGILLCLIGLFVKARLGDQVQSEDPSELPNIEKQHHSDEDSSESETMTEKHDLAGQPTTSVDSNEK
jgi:hypothetical protein